MSSLLFDRGDANGFEKSETTRTKTDTAIKSPAKGDSARDMIPVLAVIPTTCVSHTKPKDINNNIVADAIQQMKTLEKSLHTSKQLHPSPKLHRRTAKPLETVAEMSESEDNSQHTEQPSSHNIQQLIAKFQMKIEKEATRSKDAKYFHHSDSENSPTPAQNINPAESPTDSSTESRATNSDVTDGNNDSGQNIGLTTSPHSNYCLLVTTNPSAKLTCPLGLTKTSTEHKDDAVVELNFGGSDTLKSLKKPESVPLNHSALPAKQDELGSIEDDVVFEDPSPLNTRERENVLILSTESESTFPTPPDPCTLAFEASSPTSISSDTNTVKTLEDDKNGVKCQQHIKYVSAVDTVNTELRVCDRP